MIFHRGPGESFHKYFVKTPGDDTRRRVREFARQIPNRIYECMIFEIANERVMQQNDSTKTIHPLKSDDDKEDKERRVGSHNFVGNIFSTFTPSTEMAKVERL